jgi:Fe-S-cluster containining protein
MPLWRPVSLVQIERRDQHLLRVIDASMSEATRRSGDWVVCRAGCTQCCIGPFAITQLDALRLRNALERLAAADPSTAGRIRHRALDYLAAIRPEYPGDPLTGLLEDEDQLPASMDETPCPALDPETGRCDLYDARPVTCRTFGPATCVGEEAFAACELCYQGATDEQIAACAAELDAGPESALLAELASQGMDGMTIVAFALAGGESSQSGRT